MNVQQTIGASAALEIRELTATELDHVSGGHQSGIEWMINFIGATWTLALSEGWGAYS